MNPLPSRYLKAAVSWKRIRYSQKNQRAREEFEAAHRDSQELPALYQNEELELWGWYETGFVGQLRSPLAKQPVGETQKVPSEIRERV